MGIFEYLLGSDRDHDDAHHPRKAPAAPDVDEGRSKTPREKDLWRVQGQHDSDTDSFREESSR